MSKQSAQHRYVTAITDVSCSSRHASLGNRSTGKRRTHDLSGRKPRCCPLSHRVNPVYFNSYFIEFKFINKFCDTTLADSVIPFIIGRLRRIVRTLMAIYGFTEMRILRPIGERVATRAINSNDTLACTVADTTVKARFVDANDAFF